VARTWSALVTASLNTLLSLLQSGPLKCATAQLTETHDIDAESFASTTGPTPGSSDKDTVSKRS